MATLTPSGTFADKRPGYIQVNSTGNDIIFGTCMFTSAFGEVTKFDLTREADEALVNGGMGQLVAMILKNFRYVIKMEAIIQGEAKLPGPGDEVEFPMVGVKGRIKGAVQITADGDSARKISFEAWSWDSLDNSGAGTATVVDPANINPV